MWPVQGAYGVRLDYGTPGAALYAPSLASDGESWIYPKLHDNGVKFRHCNYHRVWAAGSRATADDRSHFPLDFARRQLGVVAPETFVPGSVLRTVTADSARQELPPLVHPLQSDLLDYGFLRDYSSDSRKRCMAYVSGINGSVINFAAIKTTVYAADSGYTNIEVPEISATHKLDMNSEILGIKFSGNWFSDNARAFVAIRTTSDCHFYRPGMAVSEFGNFKYVSADYLLHISKRMGQTYSDVTCNPWYWKQAGVIDTTGTFGVYEIGEILDNRFSTLMQMRDVTENTRAHKIQWGLDLNHVLVYNRGSIQSFDIRGTAKSTSLMYTPKSTAAICDIKSIPGRPNEIFVAMSDCLSWMDLRMFPKESLSWAHYKVTDGIRSLRCSPFTVDDDSYCLLYSSADQITSCYQFGLRDDIPVSLDDPYIFQCEKEVRSLDMITIPLKFPRTSIKDNLPKLITTFQLLMDYSLIQNVYFSDSGLVSPKALDIIADSRESTALRRKPLPEADYNEIPGFRAVDLSAVYEAAFVEDDDGLVPMENSAFFHGLQEELHEVSKLTSVRLHSLHELPITNNTVSDISSFSSELNHLPIQTILRGFSVSRNYIGNLPYIASASSNAQDIYAMLMTTWVQPLSTDFREVTLRISGDLKASVMTVDPIPIKVRLRRERIARKIAADIALGSVVLVDDDGFGDGVFGELSKYVDFKRPHDNTAPNENMTQLTASWEI
ncbi:RNA polymerase I-specific transcription initiation factor RRN6-like protein [Limtongia smithiae]|uniref:RNA polymerase I-specific transcription initiation factor RRN6-like protein n=1 Tax=Limtongia smithiae TaxID=1125753 RepID=UPI0034CFF93D